MQYMMLTDPRDNSFGCFCGSSLSDLTDTPRPWPVEDYELLPPIKELGEVWRIINQWKSWLLPDTSDPKKLEFGIGGIYPESNQYYETDALHKLYLSYPYAAVYKLKDPPMIQADLDLEGNADLPETPIDP